jgi:hypothetical protein
MNAAKTEIRSIDATPEKRMFWSIISDYDLKTGLFELVDNALDMWASRGRKQALRVEIDLDADRQVIGVKDNAAHPICPAIGHAPTRWPPRENLERHATRDLGVH